jgi:hypothetical protein
MLNGMVEHVETQDKKPEFPQSGKTQELGAFFGQGIW